MVYQWKKGAHMRGDAQAIGERLETLHEVSLGRLTPEAVVNDARDPAAPHHECFEWDDAQAAEQYRVTQARELIRSIAVVIEERPEQPVRAFVCVIQEGDEDRSYTSVEVALRDDELRQQVIAQAKAEMAALMKKYRHLEEFSRLFAQIDQQLQLVA